MRLTDKALQQNQNSYLKAGIALPQFDREKVKEKTRQSPTWIHFGSGNIFRAFPAAAQQRLLEQALADTGIVVAEGYDSELIDTISRPCNDLSLLVTLKGDGTTEKSVIASITQSLKAFRDCPQDYQQIEDIFKKPSLQMASFTITEKGYELRDATGKFLPLVEKDITAGPDKAESYIGKLAGFLYCRFENGQHPIALVSMDNCSHNGEKLHQAVEVFASQWEKGGFVKEGFLAWLNNPEKVSFPLTMIDKITPRPDEGVKDMLEKLGFEDAKICITQKNTYAAPFVNAEETEYLVVEDLFPNGRPALEKAGIIFTDRETVDKVEKMKVCTCLNPLHTAMSIFGCLLGYSKISDEMKDPDILTLIETVGYTEGLPVVVNPGILSPKEFIDTVITTRLPNPFMPDTPQRIAVDTSQKLPVRFGETIKAYLKNGLELSSLKAIPLVFAGWLRYLLGVDDLGQTFQPSPDPKLAYMQDVLQGIKLGSTGPFTEQLRPVLSDQSIFGVDLFQVGLAQTVEDMFAALCASPGSVRKALQVYLG